MEILTMVIVSLFGLIGYLGVCAILLEAFKDDLRWGLFSLLIPPVLAIYTVTHWKLARTGALLAIVGFTAQYVITGEVAIFD